MYTPDHFALDDEAIRTLLAAPFAGELITDGPDGLAATRAPFAYDPDAGELGTLSTHLGRVNPQWRHAGGDALVILTGPQAYIASEWLLADQQATPVPTWDYVTVHAWGELVVRTEPDAVAAGLSRLTQAFGRAYHDDFRADRMPSAALEPLLGAMVGVEVRLTRWAGKAKMSQNKPPAVVERIADGLALRGDRDAAAWLRETSLPRARAKRSLLDGIRLNDPAEPKAG